MALAGTSVLPTLTVTGITASNKVYDGTTAATLDISGAQLVGVTSGDDVQLNISAVVGTFSNKNAGLGKTVTISGLTLIGANAGNYTLVQPTVTADITPKPIVLMAYLAQKTYDGTNVYPYQADVLPSDGVVKGDSLVLHSLYETLFQDPNVGSDKTVTISGIQLDGVNGNYTYNQTLVTTDSIIPASVNVKATGMNKIYDGTTNASVILNVSGALNGDVLNATGTANFNNKNVGTNKPIHVTGITLTGDNATNYTSNDTTDTVGNITKADQTIIFGHLTDKTYGDHDFALSASADSGLAVTFSASGTCSVSGNTIHIVGPGSCDVTAHQTGNNNYNSALDVTQSFNIDNIPAPIITLNGDATSNLTVGDTYTEQGATVFDVVDGTTTATVGGDIVDTSVAGTYNVTYNATDTAGNQAVQVTRTVVVTAPVPAPIVSAPTSGYVPQYSGGGSVATFSSNSSNNNNSSPTALAVAPTINNQNNTPINIPNVGAGSQTANINAPAISGTTTGIVSPVVTTNPLAFATATSQLAAVGASGFNFLNYLYGLLVLIVAGGIGYFFWKRA